MTGAIVAIALARSSRGRPATAGLDRSAAGADRPQLVGAGRRWVENGVGLSRAASRTRPAGAASRDPRHTRRNDMARWLHTLFGVILGWAALPALAAPGVEGIEGRLVGPSWLAAQRAEVLLLDASMPQQFAAGHIPGAVNASVFFTSGRDVPAADMERRLRAWGVSPGRKIVVYDEGGSWMATRLFHDLHYHGVPLDQLYLLDGGLHQWKAKGQPVTKEPTPAPPEGSFRVTRVLDETRVKLPEFLAATADNANHAIVDALEPPYYYGGAKFFDRGGHIPNARLWPSSDFFHPDSKTFKSTEEIRRMLAAHGIQPAQTVHVYCGGGGAASVPVFALTHLLGRDKVKLYNASQREWLQDERGLPLWTHPKPAMLRRAAWLDGWSGPMLRMAGFSQISVVDVRSPAAYAQGHAPFALNLPAETFRAHIDAPDKLAELLGAAGVNPRHEAVIVAERGLTPEVALAWWQLERLGQRRVSLLAESFDDWALAGLPVVKEPTTVGAPKSPQDLAVPPATYRAAVAANKASSAYPTVYLAAGAKPSASAPAGARLVHLPYTDLLTADGWPKPAKDLWSLLAKAGVPRYGEIVAVSEQLGEAAAAVFVLRLMGFADATVGLPR
jgi:3-mercaptopyruvate sulfurtransferase SseA